MFRAVIFDFFGTLTEAVARGPAHQRIARRLGCDPDDFAAALNDTFMARSVGALGDPISALADVAGRLGSFPSDRRLRQVAGQRIAAVAADTRLRPAAVPVLRRLRRLGVSIGLVSDCGPELPEFLPELPIAPLLDAVVLSIDLQRHKPDPRMYWDACRRLRVDPAECLYVGDGGSQELTGAAAAGMTAVRLAAPDLGGHLVFGADTGWAGASVESLEEIVPMVAAARPSAAATPRRPVPPRLRLA